MGSNIYRDTIEREIAQYGDQVRVEYQGGGKHPRAVIYVGGKSKFLTFPSSASDNVRGPLNMRSNLRRILSDLGARPEGPPPARLAVYHESVLLSIPKSSPLFSTVAKNRQVLAWWAMEAVSNPDLKGEPFLALRYRGPVKEGEATRRPGMLRGSFNASGEWQATVMNSRLPAIAKLGPFAAVPLRLLRQEGDDLVFKLPPANLRKRPAGYNYPEPPAEKLAPPAPPAVKKLEPRAHHGIPEPAPVPPPPRAPVPAREKEPPPAEHAHHQKVHLDERPLQLVLPKEPVSLQRAIRIVNHHKEKMGDNLSLSITPEGYLLAIAQFGGK
jgi:hypothetical protein